MKMKVFVLYGGKSVEHDVSLKTAFTVLQAMDRETFTVYPVYINRHGLWCCNGELAQRLTHQEELLMEPDTGLLADSLGLLLSKWLSLPGQKVVMPLLHGTFGEDGTVQGLLELLDVPYVGNGVLASALTLDKAAVKLYAAHTGIRQAEYVCFTAGEWRAEQGRLLEAASGLGFPCYVKPASLGSSIGISRCNDCNELAAGIQAAFQYDVKVVVEREIAGREIQVAVLGNEIPLASLPGEFIHRQPFFDFESKYMDKELTMSIPAELSEEQTQRLRQNAKAVYRALGCSGLARVDFFIDQQGEIFLNEVNALPGFTSSSMYPVMWEKTDGTAYGKLIESLIAYAIQRHESKQAICYTR